jgi:hypothetical protein
LLFEFCEEVEGVERLELIKVGVAEFVEHGAVERSEELRLMAVAMGSGGAGGQRFSELVFALLVFLEDFASALDYAARQAGEAGVSLTET